MAERQLLVKILGDAGGALKAFGETEKGAGGLKDHLGVLAGAIGGALSVGAAVEFGKKSVEAFDEVAHATVVLQRETGGSAESMSRLRFAAQETGISSEQLEKGLAKASKAAEANHDAFDKNNITIRDAHGAFLPLNDVLQNTAEKFASMPNGIEKNALAMQLFGKSGVELLPLLNKGKDGIAELEKESDKLGLTLGQKNVDDYKKNVVATREMHAAIEGLQVQIGARLQPVITTVTTWLAEKLPGAMAFLGNVFEHVASFIGDVVDAFRGGFENPDAIVNFGGWEATVIKIGAAAEHLWEQLKAGAEDVAAWFVDHWPQIQNVLQVVFDAMQAGFGWLIDNKPVLIAVVAAIAAVIVGPFLVLAAAFAYAYANSETFRDGIQAVVDTVANVVQSIITWVQHLVAAWNSNFDDIKAAFNNALLALEIILAPVLITLKALWDGFHDHIFTILTIYWGYISGTIQAALDIIKGIINIALGLLSGDWGRAWDGVRQVLDGAWQLIVTTVTTALALVQQLLLVALGIINSLWQTAWGLVESTLQGAWNAITGAVSSGVDNVVSFFTGLPERATGALANLAGQLGGLIGGAVDGMKQYAEDNVANLLGWFGGLPGRFVDMLGDIGSRLGGVMVEGLKGAWNAVARIWNNTIGGQGFSVPDWVPVFGGDSVHVPNLPILAMGGIVPGSPGMPTLAVVHGGEAVLNPAEMHAFGFDGTTPGGYRGGGTSANITVYVTVMGSVATAQELSEVVRNNLIKVGQRNGTGSILGGLA